MEAVACGTAALSEIERLNALARYASERDRLPVEAVGTVVGNLRRTKWRRWLAGSLLPGLMIDSSFVGADRSLEVGLTGSDYVSFAQIGVLLYAALALAVLARRLWKSKARTNTLLSGFGASGMLRPQAPSQAAALARVRPD
jgi:hypothetical protein